jgi:hypothetical protein
MRASVLLAIAAAACGAGTITLPARPAVPPSRPIVVDMTGSQQLSANLPPGVGGGVQRHIAYLLSGYGFQVLAQPDDDTVIVHVVSYDRNHISADVSIGWGAQPERVDADASSCTSVGWGVYVDQNEDCLARALVVKLFATESLARSYGPAPLHVAHSPGSFTRPGDGAVAQQCRSRDTLERADCEERLGHLATAWSLLRKAAGVNYTDELGARITAIEPRLARMRVSAPMPLPPGLVVTRDGTEITSLLELDIPVDPGDHMIEATAPGYTPFSYRATVRGEGTTTAVTVQLTSSR